jgi:predicted GNAT superfamily acetyltransferase/acyl carrier protein
VHARAAELTQRTNQFNCTTKRYSQAELTQLLQSGTFEGLIIRLSDRFGDYGAIGLMLFAEVEGQLQLDTFLLSCRAMGRGVEHAMLAQLGKLAERRALSAVRLAYQQTSKNEPARLFLQSLGLTPDGEILILSPTQAAAVRYEPNVSMKPQNGEQTSKPGKGVNAAISAAHFEHIMRELADPLQIVRAIEQSQQASNKSASYIAPRNELETRLCELWALVLRLDRIGIEDNFFDIGGHSLSATRLVAEIFAEWNVSVPIKVVFDFPHVKDLSLYITKALDAGLHVNKVKGITARNRKLEHKENETYEL